MKIIDLIKDSFSELSEDNVNNDIVFSDELRERIYSRIKGKIASRQNAGEYNDSVSSIERYRKPVFRRVLNVSASVAAVGVIALSSLFIFKNSNDTIDNNYPKEPFSATSENNQVTVTNTTSVGTTVITTSYTTASTNKTISSSTSTSRTTVTDKSEITADTDTIIANTDNAVDYDALSGYWYENGDPIAAFFHITKDGRFKEYNNHYGAIMYYTGYIRRELDTKTNSYFYCMYLDTGELYKRFADDGEKSDINFESGDPSHYVKLYSEGGIGDDGREAEEAYPGSWICGRAIIEISYKGEDMFQAKVSWSSSATAHTIWDYPLTLDNGKLICNGNGKMTLVEFKDGETKPTETVKYTDGAAEFTLEGNHLFWNDLNEHSADIMLFEKNSEAY